MYYLGDVLGIYRAELEEVGHFGCVLGDVLFLDVSCLDLLVIKPTSLHQKLLLSECPAQVHGAKILYTEPCNIRSQSNPFS